MKWYYYVIIILSVIILPFIISLLCFFISHKLKHEKLNKQGSTPHRKPLLYRIFIELPKCIINDMFNREEFEFNEYGIHMFCGEQGKGKTIAMVEMMLRWQKQYPKMRTITNFGYTSQNDNLVHWRQLLDYVNGKQGVCVGIDEIQAWFQSGKVQLPPEMLSIVCQNRKNRRAIVCTSQVFTRVNKGLREQVSLVYKPCTIFGGFTIVLVQKPVFDDTGVVTAWRFKKIYCFAHTQEIRNAYDTYKVINALSEDGFKPECCTLDKSDK